MKTKIFLSLIFVFALMSFVSATCTDSDGGKDYFNVGTAQFIHPTTGDDFVETDYCTDETNLHERYCKGDYEIGDDIYACPNGCSNGACLNEGIIPPAPAISEEVPVECQFYSYSEDEVIGNICFYKENSAYNCTTETSHISSRQGNTNYYGSKCEFKIPMKKDESKKVVASCENSSYERSVSFSIGSLVGHDNYLRFCCGSSNPSFYDKICINKEGENNENPEICDSIGLRQNGKFCTADKFWKFQIEDGESCENHFECKSYTCISNECVSSNLIQKILNWFKKLFGGN